MSRVFSVSGTRRVIVGLGVLYTALAMVRVLLAIAVGKPFTGMVADFIVIGGPGILILYGGYRLPETDLHPDVYPRIATWCLGGFGLMLSIVILRVLDPGVTIDSPLESAALATALGSLAGLAIGMYEARALSRAHEAEQRNRELQRERSLRERIVETSPIGISVIDTNRTVSFVNEHAAELVGLPVDELTGLEYDTSMFEATDADGSSFEEGLFHEVLATGEPVYDAERQMTRADGERIRLSVNAAPLRDSSGDVTAVVFASEDVTERKEQKQRLKQQNNRLESFAGMLAHELRNPLTIAQIYHPQAVNGDGDAADQVETAHNRIEEMIDILLVTVRTSDVNIKYQSVGIADIATDAWEDLSAETEMAAANLVVETEQTIQADPTHLEHLLRNLFRNSLEHGEEDTTVRIGDLDDGFYVEDNGPGIPEDAREDVVEAGFTTKADGIGLGLTFIARLAEIYNWNYTITESGDGGARFEFTDVNRVSQSEEMHQH